MFRKPQDFCFDGLESSFVDLSAVDRLQIDRSTSSRNHAELFHADAHAQVLIGSASPTCQQPLRSPMLSNTDVGPVEKPPRRTRRWSWLRKRLCINRAYRWTWAETADVNDAISTTDVAVETSTADHEVANVNDASAENTDRTTDVAEETSTAFRSRWTRIFKRPHQRRRRGWPRGRQRPRELVEGHVHEDTRASKTHVGLADCGLDAIWQILKEFEANMIAETKALRDFFLPAANS